MKDTHAWDVVGPQPEQKQLHFGFHDEEGKIHPDMDVGTANVGEDGEDDNDKPQ